MAVDGARGGRRRCGAPCAVVAVTLLLLVSIGLSSRMLRDGANGVLNRLDRIERGLHDPQRHLTEAIRANDLGHQAVLDVATAPPGDRTELLEEAVDLGNEIDVSFSRFRHQSIGLPGEAELIAAFDADLEAAQAATAAALAPLLTSGAPGMPTAQQVDASRAVTDDLVALRELYHRAEEDATADLALTQRRALDVDVWWTSVRALLAVAVGAVAFRFARRSGRERAAWAEQTTRAAFEVQLQRALELALDGPAAFGVAARALVELEGHRRGPGGGGGGGGSSVVVAEADSGELVPVGTPPVCGVSVFDACPVVRSGAAFSTTDSGGFGSCPVLASSGAPACSAACVPVSVTGRIGGVVQVIGPVGAVARRDDAELVARHVGDRVTLLDALATSRMEASRDPLTGLLNRRSLDGAVQRLLAVAPSYAVAFGDLDHFKQLNDTFGHDAGDRALRAFAHSLRESVRPQDLVCRWGGEEFVVLLPDCDAALAAEAMDRVRTNVALASVEGRLAPVRVSFGVADSSDANDFDAVLERADTALREAKRAGRDRVVRYARSDLA